MLLLSWNIRGLNSPLKQHEVVSYIKNNNVYGLLKTKLTSSKLQFMHKFRLKNWRSFSNVEAVGIATIIVLWNPSTVKVDLIDLSTQAFHVSINSLESQYTFATTFVYSFNMIIARRQLWDDLRSWAPACPCIILGDFNSIMSI